MSEIAAPSLDIRLRRTRKALRDALFSLLSSKSFDAISIREITARAGVGYATFYRHYPAKEGLLHELADAEVRELISIAMPLVFSASMHDSCLMVCSRVHERQGLWRAMLAGGAGGVLREEFFGEIKKLKGHYDGLSGWLPEELHLICSTGATLDVLSWWLNQRPMWPIDQVADILERLITTLTTRKFD